jgi:hypothetical protein
MLASNGCPFLICPKQTFDNNGSAKNRCWRILLKKSFVGSSRKVLEPLMRFVHDDVRDLVASQKNDHGLRIGATAHPNGEVVSKISICEIFGVVRFSTFSTASGANLPFEPSSAVGCLKDKLDDETSSITRFLILWTDKIS